MTTYAMPNTDVSTKDQYSWYARHQVGVGRAILVLAFAAFILGGVAVARNGLGPWSSAAPISFSVGGGALITYLFLQKVPIAPWDKMHGDPSSRKQLSSEEVENIAESIHQGGLSADGEGHGPWFLGMEEQS